MPERDSKQPEGKPAEHKPEDAREEAEGRPDAADQPEEEGGLDVRVFLVGLLIVAFIVAAYINRQYYAKPKKPPPPPAAVPGTGAGPSGPAQGTAQPAKPPTPAEHYAGIVAQSKFQISHEIFVCHGQTFLLARPAVPISQKTRDGGFLILKAMLFDITKRLDGIAEQAFTRRWVPPGEPVYRGSPMFVSLGLNDKLRPLLVEAEEAGLEPKPPEGEAEPKEEQPRRIVVRDSEAVIGVTHEGRAKAYPVRILNFHDVVNDTIAETPIAVTWTAVADAATVIVRSLETEGKSVELHFGSAGLMHNSGVVVYDLENDCLWSSLRAVALTGKLAGRRLPIMPSVKTSWGYWRKLHPQTEVLVGTVAKPPLDLKYVGNPALPRPDYLRGEYVAYPVEEFDYESSPIPALEPVLGVAVGEDARAYPYSRIEQAEGPIRDMLGGKQVVITYDAAGGFAQAHLADDKGAPQEPVPSRSILWLVWFGIHPKSDVYGVKAPPGSALIPGATEEKPKDKAAPDAPAPAPPPPPSD